MPAPSYGLLTHPGELETVAGVITAARLPFGFDIETGYDGESREKAQLHPEENFVAGFSLTNDLSWARYGAVRHDSGVNLDSYAVAEQLWPLFFLRDAEGRLLGVSHGGIFEKRCMARFFMTHLADHEVYGAQVRALGGYVSLRSDTMLESYVEGIQLQHGLKPLTEATFGQGDPTRPRRPGEPGHKMTEIMELFPAGLTEKQKNSIRFNVLDQHDPRVYSYAGEDALWCLANHLLRFPRVRDSFIFKLEMALLEEVLPGMADFGVWWDWDLVRDAGRRAHEFLPLYEAEVREEFEKATGQPCTINFASTKQFSKLLYEDMGLPVVKRTPKGAASTNAKEALPNYVKEYPAVAKYVEWKELETLCNNYLDTYERKFSYAPDGMTHPNLLQHGTVSGRFACDSPNYQQASKKKYKLTTRHGVTFEFQLRKAIGAPPGWYMLGYDYSMVELRVVAGEAQEEGLLEAFRNGVDVHRKTAALMLGIAFEEAIGENRQVGKTCNFSLGYGQAAKALSERLGCSLERAEELYDIYHSSYPRLNKKRLSVIAQARRDGYVITKFSRKVPLPDILLPADTKLNRKRKADAERTAGNVFVQGPGSGDYPKMAMVRAVRALKAAGLDDRVKLVMNVHDALEFYVRKDVPPAEVIRVLQPAVVFPVPGWPPITADWHIGLNWAELKEIEVMPDGSVRVKGAHVPSPAPDLEDDGYEPDEGVVLEPRGPVGGDVGGPPVPGGPGGVPVLPVGAEQAREVIIETPVVPRPAAFQRLLGYAASVPGANQVTLQTPDGSVRLPGTSGLSPACDAEVSVLLSGAVVRYSEGSVDMTALGEGLRV